MQKIIKSRAAMPVLLLGTLAAMLVALWFAGELAPQLLGDPGVLVRWGQPIAKAITNLAMTISIGTIVLIAFASNDASGSTKRGLNLVAGSGVVWVLAGLANLVLTYLTVAGTGLISLGSNFSKALNLFIFDISLGQAMSLNLVFGALLATGALLVRKVKNTVYLVGLGAAALVPLAVSGHASGTADHADAVNSTGLHLVAIVLWVGGLVGLLVMQVGATSQLKVALLRRYSALALFAFVLTAFSGVAAALVRTQLQFLFTTSYGWIVIAKVVTLVVLGAFGAWYRLRLIDRAAGEQGSRVFAIVAVVELFVMGIAMGLGTALSRTGAVTAEVPFGDVTPAQILTGSKLPPEITNATWFTVFKPDLIWVVVCVAAVVFYSWGVLRLRARGDKWSPARTTTWMLGIALLAYITCGPINVYQDYLFSVHMIGHMILSMGVPVLLVPGAPITLLLRAVEKRDDGSWGAREWVLWAVNTPWARLVSNPLFASVNFAVSLVLFYFTPLFSWSVHDHLGHEWMVVHFLITGYLFAQALVGVDPGPKLVGYPIRLMLLLGTLTFHAFLGLSLMNGDTLLLADWFGAMGRTWGATPLEDQHIGGGIAWGVGELPTAVLTIIVAVQWARADQRESTRLDRASDRSGGKDLEEYNAMLARLAERKDR